MSEMMYDIEYEKQKVLSEIRNSKPGFEALDKLRYIREHIDWAVEGYRNSLTILSDTTYEDRKHFLMELIQNADDADYGNEIPEIRFYITDEGLELYYNEVGFTVEDIISITDTGASTKKTKKNNSTSFIGEKGIGFKSVFALAETVEIHSGSWHFLLGKDQCIVPKPIAGQGVLSGTRQIIRFTDEHVTEEIFKELKRYIRGDAETFIYLQKISKFALIDKRKGSFEKYEIEIFPTDRSGDRLTLRILNTGEEREYLLYSENIHFTQELVASRWEKIGTSLGSVDRKVTLAAALYESGFSRPGRLFCYLPTSVSLPIPVYLQVDGVTKADREKLHDPQNNQWNKHLLAQLPKVIARAVTHWAKVVESPEQFNRLIPIDDGQDQLWYVFHETRRIMKEQSWVKILSDKPQWKQAELIMGFPPYLNELFTHYPEIRDGFSSYLKKYILHNDWYENFDLRKKLILYRVQMASDVDILSAFRSVELPPEIIQSKEKLLDLYQFMIDLLDCKYSKIKDPSDDLIKLKIKYMRELKVFPVYQKGFLALGLNENIYYQSNDNIDKIYDKIMLIDKKYLKNTKYTAEELDSLSEEEKLEIRLSETLNILLRGLGVKELSDEIILTDFIIPELKSGISFSREERLEKFFYFFEYYVQKKKQAKINKKIFDETSEIKLFGKDNNLYQMKRMLIPQSARMSASESNYDDFGLQEMLLPLMYQEKIKEEKILFHDFLIECGIRYKPIFHVIKEEYSDASDFRVSDRERFDIWRNRIGMDYTSNNRVTVERIILDEIDQEIIKNGNTTVEYERYLYNVWMDNFNSNEINDYSYYYKGGAIPGYFTIVYKRNERRCLQLKDLNWAGVDKTCIPVHLFNGAVVTSSKANILPSLKDMKLHYLYEHLNGVLRDDVQYPNLSYSKLYLETLEVPEMKYQNLEGLWEKVNENHYEDIIEMIYKMISSNILYSSIRIMDKRTKLLTDLKEFKLGQMSFEDEPLIEIQYGEFGKRLGEAFGLTKGGSVESYKNTITALLQQQICSEQIIRRFMNLLQEWNTYKANEKIIILSEFSAVVQGKKPPILVLGEPELNMNLIKNKIWSILLPEDYITADRNLLYRASGEIGFILPDSFGKLELRGKEAINTNIYQKCDIILSKYLELLEDKERKGLDGKLKVIGGIDKVLKQIVFATSAYREEKASGISYEVNLPYLDTSDRKIILLNSMSEYDIIEAILLTFEFAPKRNVERDLLEIKKSQERYLQAQEKIEKEEYKEQDESEVDEINTPRKAPEINDGVKVSNSKDPKTVEINATQNVQEVLSTLKDKLSAKSYTEVVNLSNWKLGPNPEEELEIRETLVENITSSLNHGPEVYRRKLRNLQKRRKIYQENELGEDEVLIDKDSIESRSFLEAEYDSRCQVCGKQIVFDSGKKWVSVYHIQDKKDGAWYYNRPFNILGLCPNCYTMAKYSGNRDFSKLLSDAQKVLDGDTFAEPVDEFGGDYYLVDVVLDNKSFKMKLSKVHMSYFAALVAIEENK